KAEPPELRLWMVAEVRQHSPSDIVDAGGGGQIDDPIEAKVCVVLEDVVQDHGAHTVAHERDREIPNFLPILVMPLARRFHSRSDESIERREHSRAELRVTAAC